MGGQIPPGYIKQTDGSYSKTHGPYPASAFNMGKTVIKVEVQANTDEGDLNKLETAFLSVLRSRNYQWVGIQSMTLKLGFDTRYTPDFIALDQVGHLLAFETKGFFRDDAKVKLKVAARVFPFIEFFLVTKDKSGWKEIMVRP